MPFLTSEKASTERDLNLDFVKGILVAFMVIYHIMNIFSHAGPEVFGHIRFVSGSFLFISGYIISLYYEKKFTLNKAGTTRRLFVRGLKLMAIFTILNIAINFTGIGNPIKSQLGMQHFINNVLLIYGIGSPGYASFQILLPLSYLLILSPACLWFSKIKAFVLTISLNLMFFGYFFNVESVNIGLGIIGFIGLFGGMAVNKSGVSFLIKNRAVIIAFLLICFYLMKYFDRNVATYAFGIALFIKLFYDFGITVDPKSLIFQIAILLGQYSLLCYIAQIIFLQCFSLALSRPKWNLGEEIILLFFSAIIFLVALCIFLSYLRNQYKFLNKSYNFIFS